jgi:salicylate synthase
MNHGEVMGVVQNYYEITVRFTGDPLAAVSSLASAGDWGEYVVYEHDGEWAFAGGALAEITLDRSGARMLGPAGASVPWDGPQLRGVRELLNHVPVAGWRAYGWAAFELAYTRDGDIAAIGGQRLMHLMVPRAEVRLRGDRALLRSVDPETLRILANALSAGSDARPGKVTPVEVRLSGSGEYQRAVEVAIKEIADHRFQKVILSRVVQLQQDIDFLATFVSGRLGNNPARSFLLRMGGLDAAGFSPEIVVRVGQDKRVVTQPLAGTRALTRDPARNERLRAELLSDSKEIYEHAISVKTACDDLLEVCAPGSLAVEEFMTVRDRGTVQHLASRVAGQLAEGKDAWDAFGAVFPAVTASGIPREAAYASIRALEPDRRGLYSGAVLVVDAEGTMDAALVLRAVYREDGHTWLRAGAGIVGESHPAREFEETCEKLDSVARFLVPAS